MNKKFNIFFLIFFILGVIANSEAVETPNRKELLGHIIIIDEIPATRKSGSEVQTDVMGGLFGFVGVLFTEFMSIEERGYYVYNIETKDGAMIQVYSRSNYAVGDCVVISYPESMGDSPNVGLEEDVNIKKSSSCAPI